MVKEFEVVDIYFELFENKQLKIPLYYYKQYPTYILMKNLIQMDCLSDEHYIKIFDIFMDNIDKVKFPKDITQKSLTFEQSYLLYVLYVV